MSQHRLNARDSFTVEPASNPKLELFPMSSLQTINCSGCGVALKTAGLPAGKSFRCPKCQGTITIPAAANTAIQAQDRRGSPAPVAAAIQVVRAAPAPDARRGASDPAPTADRRSPAKPSTSSKSRLPLILGGAGTLAVVVIGVVLLVRGLGSGTEPRPGPDPAVTFVPKIDPVTGLPNNPADETIVAWGPAKPLDYKKPIVLKGHRPGAAVVALAYSPDGAKLASANDHGEFILWNLSTGQGRVVMRNTTHEGKEASLHKGEQVSFSADGKTLFTNSARGASAWDTETLWGRARFGNFTEEALLVSPNGKTLVTERPAVDRGKGYGFNIWEVTTQKSLFTITIDERDFAGGGGVGHFGRYSPDGRYLAMIRTATQDVLAKSAIRLFDLEAGKELPSIGLPHLSAEYLSEISIDARFLSNSRLAFWEDVATGPKQPKVAKVSVWDIGGGNGQARPVVLQPDVLQTLATESATYQFLQKPLSNDGKLMAYLVSNPKSTKSNPLPQEIAVHDSTTLKTLASFPVAGGSVIAISADGKSILSSVYPEKEEYDDFACVRTYDAASGAKRALLRFPLDRERKNAELNAIGDGNAILAASPTQPATVAAGLADGVIVIAPVGEQDTTFPKGWKLTPQSPEVQSGAVQLITTAPDLVVPLQAKQRAEIVPDEFAVGSLALSRDASLLVAPGGLEGNRVWDVKTGKERLRAPIVDNSTFGAHPRFTPDNRFVIDELPTAIDVDSGKVYKPADELMGATSFTLTPDGKKLLMGRPVLQGGSSKICNLLSLPGLTVERATLDFFEGTLTAVKFSNDGKHLAAALHHQGNMRLLMLNPSTGEIVKTLEQVESRDAGHSTLDFSSDSTMLVSTLGHAGVGAGRLTLWDWPAGKLRYELGVSNSPAVLLANGRLVALSDWSETTVYDTATGNVRSHLHAFALHEPKSSASHLCRARNRLAIGYEDGVVVVFDVARHGTIVKFTAHPAEIVGMTMSLDGNTLVTAGKENKIRVWSLE